MARSSSVAASIPRPACCSVRAGPQRARPPGGSASPASCPGDGRPVDVTVQQGSGRDPAPRLHLPRRAPAAGRRPAAGLAGRRHLRAAARTGLTPGASVLFGQQLATDVTWLSSTLVSLRTPRRRPRGRGRPIRGRRCSGGFTYYDPYNGAGGVWGDPIGGSLNVAVYDSYTGDPLLGALVLLGSDPPVPGRGSPTSGASSRSRARPGRPGGRPRRGCRLRTRLFLQTGGSNVTFFLSRWCPPGWRRWPRETWTRTAPSRATSRGWRSTSRARRSELGAGGLRRDDRDGPSGYNPDPGPDATLHDDGPYTSLPARAPGRGGHRRLRNIDTDEFRPMRMGCTASSSCRSRARSTARTWCSTSA